MFVCVVHTVGFIIHVYYLGLFYSISISIIQLVNRVIG